MFHCRLLKTCKCKLSEKEDCNSGIFKDLIEVHLHNGLRRIDRRKKAAWLNIIDLDIILQG